MIKLVDLEKTHTHAHIYKPHQILNKHKRHKILNLGH